jgi:hypothetical protein
MMKSLAAAIAMTFLVFSVSGALAADEAPVKPEAANLATNPGFEQWRTIRKKDEVRTPDLADNLVPVDWEVSMGSRAKDVRATGAVYRDTEVKRSGEASVRMESGDMKTSTSLARWDLPAKASTTYRITVWVKGKGIEYAKDGQTMVWFWAGPKKTFWQDRKGVYKVLKRAGDHDWTPITCEFTTRDGDELLYINLNFRWAKGTLWIDDVDLVEVTKEAAAE